MSDLLNKASLVMVPSGYKEDTVYSVVPSDGSGDLLFTRASNGTRVNSAGLVEVCPWNLLEDTNTFSSWNLEGGTLTSGFTAPDGSSTAYKYVQIPGGGLYSGNYGVTADVKFAQVWIKSVSGGSITVNLSDGSAFFGTFNVTGEWQLFTGQYTANTRIGLYLYAISNAQGIYVWHPQLNIGSTAKPYFPTTDRLNVPRLTYQNGGGGCPSLLLEKQSTNYLIYNTEIDNAAWVKARSTVTANATTSPDGTQNADAVFVNSDLNTNHEVFQYGTGSTEGWSAFFKANGYNFIYMFGSADPVIWFDLQNGVVGTQQSGVNGKITNYGNGWYRCEYYKNSGTNSIWGFGIVPSNGVNTIASPDTSKGVYFWGAQAEAGLYATSMIPTTSSSATRVADSCLKTGISSLIGQTEGVLFMDAKIIGPPTDGSFFGVQKSASNFVIRFGYNNLGFFAQVFNGSSNLLFETISYTLGTRIKIALAYKASNYAVYANGIQMATGTNATSIPACDEVMTNSLWGSANPSLYEINQAILFPTRLTNAELASLTTI